MTEEILKYRCLKNTDGGKRIGSSDQTTWRTNLMVRAVQKEQKEQK